MIKTNKGLFVAEMIAVAFIAILVFAIIATFFCFLLPVEPTFQGTRICVGGILGAQFDQPYVAQTQADVELNAYLEAREEPPSSEKVVDLWFKYKALNDALYKNRARDMYNRMFGGRFAPRKTRLIAWDGLTTDTFNVNCPTEPIGAPSALRRIPLPKDPPNNYLNIKLVLCP